MLCRAAESSIRLPRATRGLRLGLVAIGCGALAGCAKVPGASLQQLQTRASYDLACPPQQLWLQHLDPRVKVVGGCGKQEIYVEICDEIRGQPQCTWFLNSAPVRAVVAAPSPAVACVPQPTGQIHLNPSPRPEGPKPWPSPELPFPEGWDKPSSPEYLPPGL